jgi:hypothetical protein
MDVQGDQKGGAGLTSCVNRCNGNASLPASCDEGAMEVTWVDRSSEWSCQHKMRLTPRLRLGTQLPFGVAARFQRRDTDPWEAAELSPKQQSWWVAA